MQASLSSKSLDAGRERVDPRIPVTFVTGARGAGKTALIRRIAEASPGEGLAAVFTEHASWIGAGDRGSVVARDIARGPGGMICSFARGDLVSAFYRLHLRRMELQRPALRYDRVVVEVAPGLPVGTVAALVLNDHRIDAAYRLAKVVSVVTVDEFRRGPSEATRERLAEADTLVVAHGGGRGSGLPAVLRGAVAVNPLASVAWSRRYSLDHASWRVPLGMFDEAASRRLARDTGTVTLGGDHRRLLCAVGNLHNDARSNAPGDARPVRALRMRLTGHIDYRMTMGVVDGLRQALGSDLLRMSAVINARHGDHPIAVDVIGGTLVQPSYFGQQGRRDSDICLLARGMDVRGAIAAFGDCMWTNDAAAARLEAAI